MDFSVNSTRMPEAPNTVGRDIVSPVQEQAMTTNIVPAIANVADIFMKGYAADKKAEADAYKQSVLGEYARKQAAINEGIASGELNPDVAATRSRALFSKTMAGYTQFADDIHKINNSMRSGSELGVAEDAVKAAAETQKARESAARSAGVTIYPWMDGPTKEIMLQTHEASVRSEREWKQKQERNAEQRAMSAEERTMVDRERKEDSLKMVTDIAGNNITSSSAFIQNLSSKVSQGTIPADQAAIMMTQHFSQIEAAIQAASGLNPEIASPYRSLFSDLKTLGTKAIDPKTSSETSKAMFDEIMYRAKLVAVTSDPALKATVVANSLLGGSPVTALMSIKPITDYIDKASRIDSSTIFIKHSSTMSHQVHHLGCIESNLTWGLANLRSYTYSFIRAVCCLNQTTTNQILLIYRLKQSRTIQEFSKGFTFSRYIPTKATFNCCILSEQFTTTTCEPSLWIVGHCTDNLIGLNNPLTKGVEGNIGLEYKILT